MNGLAVSYLIWAGYLGWLAVFVWLAWTGRWRLLLAVGVPMLLAFAAGYGLAQRSTGDDMAVGMLLLAAAALLVAPLLLAAIVYPVGRLWAR